MTIKPYDVARQLLFDCGLDSVKEIEIEDLISSLGCIVQSCHIPNADGKIVHGTSISIIKVNSSISNEGRKRFTLAHELGHFLMHKTYPLHLDGKSLSWFDSALHNLASGRQELEANQFASELLLPSHLVKQACQGKKFGPKLFRFISDDFKVSLTAVIFRCLELDIHPVCVFHIASGKVMYWKRSDSFDYFAINRNKLGPPQNSVCYEYIKAGYELIYDFDDVQEVDYTEWFYSKENRGDIPFYEVCIPNKKYQTVLSIIWED